MEYSTQGFIKDMSDARVLPIFYHPDLALCMRLLDVAYESGIRSLELVNRGKEAFANFVALKKSSEQLPGFKLGVGTIFDAEEAKRFVEAGAEFVVSPVLNPDLGNWCSKSQIPWIPGCGTVSEVWKAQSLGATLVKVYPAQVLGPSFISSVHAVLPDIHLIPTGGIEPTLDSIQPWMDAGALLVGMGSQLINKQWMESGDWDRLNHQIVTALTLVQHCKAKRNIRD